MRAQAPAKWTGGDTRRGTPATGSMPRVYARNADDRVSNIHLSDYTEAVRVLFATSEVRPFSQTGGLADVAGALPAALVGRGHEILVITPWYQDLKTASQPYWIGDVDVPFAGGFETVGVGTLERAGVRYAFVGHPSFWRPGLYGYPDDLERFARFTRALPQVAARLGFEPQVAHVNDWHTALLPMVLGHGWHLPDGFPGLPSLLTVHNAQFQGTGDLAEVLWWLRLSDDLRGSYLDHFGTANSLQAGIGFATRVTTVSPTYAEELGTPEYGFGLDGTFRSLAGKVSGILNGIDTVSFDPATDPHIPRNYSLVDPQGKQECGRALRHRLGLRDGQPVLGVVSRFADQKGIDLLLGAAFRLIDQGWSLALLGTGDPLLEARALALAVDRPGRVAAVIGYDDALARSIYAGADALAVPSRFEPCGLSQLIAMRYGTVPIVRATGGLADTVVHARTGFLFPDASADSLAAAAAQAIDLHGSAAWDAVRDEGMRQDFSWTASAIGYERLYQEIAATRR